MAVELVKELQFNAETKELVEVEVERYLPNPRIGEIERRLQEIKSELTQGDWKNSKYLEGALSEEAWELHKTERAELRAEYNLIETELAQLISEDRESLEAYNLLKENQANQQILHAQLTNENGNLEDTVEEIPLETELAGL